jgi:hypothetical protein
MLETNEAFLPKGIALADSAREKSPPQYVDEEG